MSKKSKNEAKEHQQYLRNFIAELKYQSGINELSKEKKTDVDHILDNALSELDKLYAYNGKILDKASNLSLSEKNWSFILSVVPTFQSLGDTIGYRNGIWEFNDGNNPKPEYLKEMINQFFDVGGLYEMNISGWRASDDTIMYLDTLEVAIESTKMAVETPEADWDISWFGEKLKQAYLKSMPDLSNRDPGRATMEALEIQKSIGWDKLPYRADNHGNGSVMRVGSIGLLFSPTNYSFLEAVIACSIITHNSTIAVLGCLTMALFVSYAAARTPIGKWIPKMLAFISGKIIKEFYMKMTSVTSDQYDQGFILYKGVWEEYYRKCFISDQIIEKNWTKDLTKRYEFLVSNFSKGCETPGGCAYDCLIMAYDSLIRCSGSYEKLVALSILHPGDSDTIGSVASQLYVLYYDAYLPLQFAAYLSDKLEMRDRIRENARALKELGPVAYYNVVLMTVIEDTMNYR